MPAWWRKLFGTTPRKSSSRKPEQIPIEWRFDHSVAVRECSEKFLKFAGNIDREMMRARRERHAASVVLGEFDPQERKKFPGLKKEEVERVIRWHGEFGQFENYCRYMGFKWEIEEADYDKNYPRHFSHTQTTGAGGIAPAPHWTPWPVKVIRLRVW